jgi:hypothetical protein
MRRTLVPTLAAVGLVALTACTPITPSSASTPPPVPEQLRDLDRAAGVHVEENAAYDQAFATLSSRCQEQGVALGNEVEEVLKLLKEEGVKDEDLLSVMQHLVASIPADAAKMMSCAQIGGAYVTLRGTPAG